MPLKNKPLTDMELAAYEAERDLAAELLQAVQEMKAGQLNVVSSPVIEARKKTGLSQSQFAALMGVSVRTLQGWEQGRKQPSGAARTLLAIASTNPKAVLAVAANSAPEPSTLLVKGTLALPSASTRPSGRTLPRR